MPSLAKRAILLCLIRMGGFSVPVRVSMPWRSRVWSTLVASRRRDRVPFLTSADSLLEPHTGSNISNERRGGLFSSVRALDTSSVLSLLKLQGAPLRWSCDKVSTYHYPSFL